MTAPAPAAVEPGLEQLRNLAALSRALTYTTSLDQVARLTVERGAALLDAEAMVLILSDADGVVHLRAAHGIDQERIARFDGELTDTEVIGRLQDVLGVDDERFIAVPLVVAGKVTGIAALATRGQPATTVEWLLAAVADHAAVALENARLSGEVRLEMERRLRASEGATDAKDRALATLAHDIRSPLGAIEGYCGILEAGIHGPLNDRQQETVARVRLSGRHLLSLLDSVMDLARLSSGAVSVQSGAVRAVEVAQEAIQILTPAADARLQTLRIGTLDDVVVSADHERLRQVLVNLIGNAVKFTPLHGTITVATRVGVRDGTPYGEMSVTDTGPGVRADDHEAIFQPYYRAEATAAAPGIGLGLAISHALVQKMGGELTLESEPGEGACFTVRLPRLAEPAAADEA